jgi:DNA-directed RNA polymerase subunit A"
VNVMAKSKKTKKPVKKAVKKTKAKPVKKAAKKKPAKKEAKREVKPSPLDYFDTYGLPKNLFLQVEKVASEMNLNEEKKAAFLDDVRAQYNALRVDAGEAVGIVAAQSMGEPGTQLTLRTKHYAGAAEVSVGSGIQRLEEIVDGRSKAKYPTMTIYLDETLKNDFKKADAFGKSLIDVRLFDVIHIDEDLAKKTGKILLMEDEMKSRNLKPEEVIDKIRKSIKFKMKRKGMELGFSFERESLLKTRKKLLKLEKVRVQGVRGIEKTIVVEENGEQVIKTSGTNLKATLKLKEVDSARTITNDIKEISKVLGIEAGRAAIIQELHKTLYENDIAVDLRHIILLADLMTYDGSIKGIVRTGITREKASPFARAAFEETIKHLLDAAFKGEKEYLQGVVENIIVGQPIKVGTGTVELIMKDIPKKGK